MMPLQPQPYMLNNQEGQSFPLRGAQVWVKATTQQTAGAFNLFEILCSPDYATPLQIHYGEDVAIYVLEGVFTIFWGGEKKVAVAGDYFFQPRGTPHGFRVANKAYARLLYLTCPAGLDHLLSEQEVPLLNSTCVTKVACFHIESLGPLPD